MEKLQNALQNARKKRAVTSAVVPTDERKPVPARDRDARSAWDQITPFAPDMKALKDNRIVSTEASNLAMPYDILRTKLMLEMKKNGWTRLAITSPSPACGKTTIALNLAFGLSRQIEKQTLLFDLDLRRPGISKYLNHKPDYDIRELYEGKVAFKDYAVRVNENLAIAGMRNTIPDPASLLNSDMTAEVLDEIQGTFTPDVMIFDLPPFLANDDTRSFLRNVDCALLVAKANDTRIDQIDTCEREVALHTNVVGIVLNQSQVTNDTYGYGYDAN